MQPFQIYSHSGNIIGLGAASPSANDVAVASGRITRQAMHEARVRVHALELFPHVAHQEVKIGEGTSTYEEMWLADEINFMLEAAREKKKAKDQADFDPMRNATPEDHERLRASQASIHQMLKGDHNE